MQLVPTLIFSATFIGPGLSTAIPKELQPRIEPPGAWENPKVVEIDCSRGPETCNADCYGILCWVEPNPVQYIYGNSQRDAQGSGAVALRKLFRQPPQAREARGVFISDDVLRGRDSPEETVMNNADEGGQGEIMNPVPFPDNRAIGESLERQILAHGVSNGQYYLKKFLHTSGNPDYCALLQAIPPDRSRCSAKGKAPADPSRTSVIRAAERGDWRATLFKMMDFDKGDRWVGFPKTPKRGERLEKTSQEH
ncbi:hypothetical protein EV356DRAFT_514087 [Viridothelium virens]|uniref:Uncharacterized protein n=1 Tax=Viridothelium virens TaxID=1048519 RepID=A0A6A6HBY3_VIRVR|nr:hypothetical protein EV356DRAFT_514087 [Viridothelium virens]